MHYLPAINHTIVFELTKNKRFIAICFLYFVLISFTFLQITHAFFTSSASSNGNSFTAAAEFPTSTPTITPTETLTPTPTPEGIADHIVISEVQIDEGVGDLNDHDFIELYNPSSASASLNGMRLVVRTQNDTTDENIILFGVSDTIPAHGYYLWAHNSTGNNFAASVSANVDSADVLGANNSIALRNGALDSGTIVDSVGWGTPGTDSLIESSAFSNPDDFQSIERKALSASDVTAMTSGTDVNKGNGYDTNNNSSDFILRPTSQPQNSSSPTETP